MFLNFPLFHISLFLFVAATSISFAFFSPHLRCYSIASLCVARETRYYHLKPLLLLRIVASLIVDADLQQLIN